MKTIPLSRGKFAKVDDADYEHLNQWKWHYSATGYAVRNTNGSGKRTSVYMHIEILKPPIGMEGDHRNLDKLDNRRGNLRVCTRRQNVANRAVNKNNVSGYKGVYKEIRGNRKNPFWARIRVNGKCLYLGFFPTDIEAARAYDEAAKKLFGEFAYLNFP